MHQKITIALDMMSGDHGTSSSAPAEIDAIKIFNDIFLLLIGDEGKINSLLSEKIKKLEGVKYRIIHTKEHISMNDDIVSAIRSKKKSSMRLAVNAVKNKEANALSFVRMCDIGNQQSLSWFKSVFCLFKQQNALVV